MKLNEKQLRKIIKNTLMEMIDPEFQKELDMQDMYDEYGNRSQYMNPAAEEMYDDGEEYEDWEKDDIDDNTYENPGYLAMQAQSDDKYNRETAQRPDLWASKKPGSYRGLSGEMYESKINKIVAESIKKTLNNSDYMIGNVKVKFWK